MKQPMTKALHEQLSDAEAFAEVVIKLRARIAELEKENAALEKAGDAIRDLIVREQQEDEKVYGVRILLPEEVIAWCQLRKFRAAEGSGK